MHRSNPSCVMVALCILIGSSLYAQEQAKLQVAPQTAPLAGTVNPQAIVPRFIKFSGTLEDMAGKPIVGVSDVTFALYAEEAGGTPLWYETQTIQADPLGRYTVLLGAMHANGVPVELFTLGEARWLGVEVGNLPETAQGGRVLLVSVPYALKALDSETLGGKPASAYMLAPSESGQEPGQTGSPTTPGTPSTNVVGTKGKTGPKPLATSAGATNFSSTTADQVVMVQQNGTGYGLYATTPSNFALFGQVTGTSGTTFAVTGITAATAGAGVLGESNATSGGTQGVLGISNSPTGVGVYGKNLATTGFAVGTYGLTSSTGGAALYGLASATSGATYGILGFSNSTSGTGINAQATATTGATTGLVAKVYSPMGAAAILDNTAGGEILIANHNGVEVFDVDGTGSVFIQGGINLGRQTQGTLTAGGSITLDYSNSNSGVFDNGNVFGNGLVFGTAVSGSGEGIASKRTTGGNQFGLDFYTKFTNRMAITNVGFVGIGTTTPGSPLEVDGTSTTQIVNVTQSGNGNGIVATTASTTTLTGAIAGTATGNGQTAGVAGIYSGGMQGAGIFGESTTASGQGGFFKNTAGGVALNVDNSTGTASLFQVQSSGAVTIGNSASAPYIKVDPSGTTIHGPLGTNTGDVSIAGNLSVTGSLSKGSGSFKIDHPLDPEHKYLYHSFVESPDMKDVYDGVVRLDLRGQAWVTLPDYFGALNGDFRYQLTSIGIPQPGLYIGREISRNRFKIAGGKPHGKVSWQVTGVRHDPYANAHRIKVEEEKPTNEQGTYLHPDAYGQPETKGAEWSRTERHGQPPTPAKASTGAVSAGGGR